MAQRDQEHLGSTGTQVQSPAQHSRLRIWHCCSCGLGQNCSLDLMPGPGTPCATMRPKKEKEKEREREKLVILPRGSVIQNLVCPRPVPCKAACPPLHIREHWRSGCSPPPTAPLPNFCLTAPTPFLAALHHPLRPTLDCPEVKTPAPRVTPEELPNDQDCGY